MAEGIIKAFESGSIDKKDVSDAVLNIAQIVRLHHMEVKEFY